MRKGCLACWRERAIVISLDAISATVSTSASRSFDVICCANSEKKGAENCRGRSKQRFSRTVIGTQAGEPSAALWEYWPAKMRARRSAAARC